MRRKWGFLGWLGQISKWNNFFSFGRSAEKFCRKKDLGNISVSWGRLSKFGPFLGSRSQKWLFGAQNRAKSKKNRKRGCKIVKNDFFFKNPQRRTRFSPGWPRKSKKKVGVRKWIPIGKFVGFSIVCDLVFFFYFAPIGEKWWFLAIVKLEQLQMCHRMVYKRQKPPRTQKWASFYEEMMEKWCFRVLMRPPRHLKSRAERPMSRRKMMIFGHCEATTAPDVP